MGKCVTVLLLVLITAKIGALAMDKENNEGLQMVDQALRLATLEDLVGSKRNNWPLMTNTDSTASASNKLPGSQHSALAYHQLADSASYRRKRTPFMGRVTHLLQILAQTKEQLQRLNEAGK